MNPTHSHQGQPSQSPSADLFRKWVADPSNDGTYILRLDAEQTEEFFRDIDRKLAATKPSQSQAPKRDFRLRQRAQVEWYRKNGRYPERIRREHSGQGEEYVTGDWSWQRLHPDKPETIESLMP